jgi:stage V sporulation protein SpoVS
MNEFLPDTYEVPQKSGNYMKLRDGENRFRILTSPILGYEWWEQDGDNRKPVRVRMDEKIVMTAESEKAKHFWAMAVYNYNEEAIQILEITQATIQKAIKALAKDKDWGTPLGYDLVVTRSGKELNTEYTVQPKPAKELDKTVADKFKATNIRLEALYEGEDPFASEVDVNDMPDFGEEEEEEIEYSKTDMLNMSVEMNA